MVALLLTLTLGATLLHNTDTSTGGSRPKLPATIEAINPERGELTGLIDDVEVDLDDRYTGVLELDGIEIPEDQLDRIEQLGVITFRPGPGKEFTRLRTGENTVVVRYWLADRPPARRSRLHLLLAVPGRGVAQRHLEHRGAAHVVGRDRGERTVGVLQRVGLERDADARLGGDLHELLGVATRHVRDRAQAALAPEQRVVERRESCSCGCRRG